MRVVAAIVAPLVLAGCEPYQSHVVPAGRSDETLGAGDLTAAGDGRAGSDPQLDGDTSGDRGPQGGDDGAGDPLSAGDLCPDCSLATCGDQRCDGGETCDACPADCGSCCEDVGAGLLSFWRFEGSGRDATGRHDLTEVGSPVLYETGHLGSGVRFEGVLGQHLRHPPDPDFDFTSAVSFSFWARAVQPGAEKFATLPFSKGPIDDNDALAQFNPNGPTLIFQVVYADGAVGRRYADDPIDDQWHHYAMVFEQGAAGDDLRLYVDGQEQVAGAAANLNRDQPLHTSSDDWRIGGKPLALSFNAVMDEFRLYTQALTDEQITQLATCP